MWNFKLGSDVARLATKIEQAIKHPASHDEKLPLDFC